MKVEYIEPFLTSLVNVLSVMAKTTCTAQKPFLKKDVTSYGDVTGLIGLAGEHVKGSLAISFPEKVILQIASRMLGEHFTVIDPTIVDMTSEIVNMVVGSAKSKLSENGHRFDMAIPSTVTGRNHTITHRTQGPVIVVPFESEVGEFFIEVCFES